MRYSLSLFLALSLCTCTSIIPGINKSGGLRAQIIDYVDSVEVHRTDTIYFAFGSAELDDTAAEKVRGLATDRPDTLDLQLYLEGHTDAVGSTSANDALARRRSQNTRAVALTAGWPEQDVQLRHFGERRLEVNTRERERRNRRVLLRSGLPRRYARVRGQLTTKDGSPLVGVAISHGPYLEDTVQTRADGTYELYLPLDTPVEVDLFAKNHFYRTRKLFLTDTTRLEDFVISLTEASQGARMSVPDLYFVGNKAVLLPGSRPTLPKLLQLMEMTPDLRIELAGHVNRPGPPQDAGSWSHNLSFKRAQRIYDYLIEFGIDKSRLRYRGYSNYEMIYPEPTGEIQMRFNRRVEVRVL